MRFVLWVRETIPGFAEAGDYVTLELAPARYPVKVTTVHGPEALGRLAAHVDHLVIDAEKSPAPEVAHLLWDVLRRGQAGRSAEPAAPVRSLEVVR